MSVDALKLYPLIRQMNADDLDCVFEIEQSAYPFPWTRGIFADCIRSGYDCFSLQAASNLVAYAIQMNAAGDCHLLNLCVAPDWQGHGYGNLMLNHAIRLARQQQCSNMFLEVRPSNFLGIRLYTQKGFFVVGERPGYYRAVEGREDAVVMRLDL
jgi:ribosomal-protein-alanine N-acetyltransferase